MTTPSQSKRRSPQAFSLVEVCLALGIVSFAFTTVLALVPLGLKTLRQGIELTTQAQILETLQSEVEMLNYTDLTNTGSSTYYMSTFPRYYDDEGEKRPGAAGAVCMVSASLAAANLPPTVSGTAASRVTFTITNPNSTLTTGTSHSYWAVDNGR